MTHYSNTKKRLLFFGEGVTLAHIVRPLTLAKSLDKNKWDVYFACDAKYKNLVEDNNLTFVPLHTITTHTFQKRLSEGVSLYTYNELYTYVEEELKVLSIINPHLVISDFRISLNISAQALHVPHISLAGAQWSPYRKESYPVPELPAVKFLGVNLAKSILPKFMPFFFKLHTKGFNRLCKKYNLPKVNSLEEMYSNGSRVLYMDIPGMFNTLPLPANHSFIGPVQWEPKVQLPEWWNTIPTDKPIVFITPGSSGDLDAAHQLVKILSTMAVTLLVATAGRMTEIKTSKNVYVSDFLPGKLTAEKADMVVCNGGNGMVYQSLAGGTPVLGFPSNMDQYYIMEAIERKGAGKLIRAGQVNSAAVKNILEQMLNNKSYTNAAKKIQKEIQSVNTVQLFEKSIEELVEGGVMETVVQMENGILPVFVQEVSLI